MRIQDTDVWNDPLVQETLTGVTGLGELADDGDINENPIMKMVLETDCLDPMVVAMVTARSPQTRGIVPAEVSDALDLAEAERVRDNGPGHLFMAQNASAIRFVLAEFASEATGDAFRQLIARPDFATLKPHVDAAASNIVDLAEGLIDSGLWREMPPKLLDKFVESMENVRSMTESNTLKRGIAAAASSLRTTIARGEALQMTEMRRPCIDPSSLFEVKKQLARTKFRL